ncbi:hypothetical protein E2C01_094319 [Portunus trituberculatus]|uniref:Uncharacterized protein n=1 Tax=Portunus trituberculatus TaxID=210409 RepID=A0A5B7JLJ2_PORTR|nr:hypothetical protein [Portunus trituberculatus]
MSKNGLFCSIPAFYLQNSEMQVKYYYLSKELKYLKMR